MSNLAISKTAADFDLKTAMVTLLKNGQQIGMDCDLACYPTSDNFYVVDYLYSDDTLAVVNLTDAEFETVMDEEELIEYFETPEEAAEFYLRLSNGKMRITAGRPSNKRTYREKVKAYDKEKYF